MYYIRGGKIEFNSDDDTARELPDPDTYPELVQFSVSDNNRIAAVDRDGYVWFIHRSTVTRLPGIKEIRSVYLYNINQYIMLSMITYENRLVNASIDKPNTLVSTTVINNLEEVISTNYWHALTSSGDVYKLNDSRVGYSQITGFPKIVVMTNSTMPVFLSEDGKAYDSKGEVVFGHKAIHSIHDGIIVTKNNEVYVRPYRNTKPHFAYEPSDILQMHGSPSGYSVLYKNGVLVDNMHTITDVDCLKGVPDLKPKSKSARGYAEPQTA